MNATTNTPNGAPPAIPGVLKLQTNVPEVIELAFPHGKPCSSQYTGDQFMFTLVDGRRWFLAPGVAAQLEQYNFGARVPIEVCKRETVVGNRRTIQYSFAKFEQMPPPAPTPAAKHEAALAISAALADELSKPAAAAPEGADARLMECYRRAIELSLAVKNHAKDRGLLLEPRFDDVRAIAATLFLDYQKQHGGRS